MESLYSVIDKINTFVYLIERVSATELPRINDCLVDLLELVLEDINSMHKIIERYTIGSKENRPLSPEENQYFWGGTIATLPGSVSVTNDTEVLAGVTKMGHILPVSLDILHSMDIYSYVSNAKQRHTSNDEYHWRQCRNIYDDIKQILMQTMSGNNSEQGEDGQNSIDKYRFHGVHDLYQRYRIYGCYYDLEINILIGDLKGKSMDTE